MVIEKDRWFYIITILFIALSIFIGSTKIIASNLVGIQIPIFNICFSTFVMLLFRYYDKNKAVILSILHLSLVFTIRPYFLPPIWASIGFYFNAAFFTIVYFDTTRRELILTFTFFFITSVVNLYISIYGPNASMLPNFKDELIAILASFIPAAYIILGYKRHISQLTSELVATSNNLQAVLDNSPNLIYSLDKEEKVMIVNKPLLSFLNMNDQEYQGKTKLELNGIRKYISNTNSIQEDELILSEEKASIRGQFSYINKNGQQAYYHYTKVPIIDKLGAIEGLLCVMNNITDLEEGKKIVEQKNKDLERYIQSNLELESFAYLASHDLKTPLRSITSFSQLLEKSAKDKLNKNELEYLGFITSSTHNMNRLITDMLEFSRVKNADYNFGEFQVEELFELLKFEFNIPIKEKAASLSFSFEQNFSIKADLLKIKQLLFNLISNALKYSKKDETPIIDIQCKEKGKNYVFSVKDNGIGIAPEHHEKIFLLLKRLHTNTSYEGTGIGLSICKSIAEKHNGTIWLDSKLGEGATFYFAIPREV